MNKKSSLQLISHANLELRGSYCIHLLYLLLTGLHMEELYNYGIITNIAVSILMAECMRWSGDYDTLSWQRAAP